LWADVLIIDVIDPRLADQTCEQRGPGEHGELAVLVEPLYGCVAVACALDAGWSSVDIAPQVAGDAPIPLVSFEQPPPLAERGGRCRVRCDDLHASGLNHALLAAPALARPLCARLASIGLERVTFLPALATGAVSADAWWACGMLVRVLLDELESGVAQLTDAAGMAVTLARGAEDPRAQLGIGRRWAHHLALGGHRDDLRVAAAVDSLGVVPQLHQESGAWVARPWHPQVATAAADPPVDRT